MFKTTGVALLEWIKHAKFSTHLPMVVYLGLMFLTGWRSHEVFAVLLQLPDTIAWPSAVALEFMGLAAIAITFNAHRDSYIAQLKNEDYEESKIGVWVGYILNLAVMTMLVSVALYDAQYKTSDILGIFVLVLVQSCQAFMTISLLVAGIIEERKNLRNQLEQWKIDEEQRQRELEKQRNELAEKQLQEDASKCKWCKKPQLPQNMKRHIDACPLNPDNQ